MTLEATQAPSKTGIWWGEVTIEPGTTACWELGAM